MERNCDSRKDVLDRFYELLWDLEKSFGYHDFANLDSWKLASDFPSAGVYFVFEEGELRAGHSDWHRVTRVGTHWVSAVKPNSKATLAQRLLNHYGRSDGTGGDSSIFRVHIGSALTGRADWADLGESCAGDIPSQVSSYMRERMGFVILPIDDPPSKDSLRRKIEVGAVALLSNYNFNSDLAIDPASVGWIGRQCITKRSPHDHVARSGLWNVDGVTMSADANFLDAFAACVERARKCL